MANASRFSPIAKAIRQSSVQRADGTGTAERLTKAERGAGTYTGVVGAGRKAAAVFGGKGDECRSGCCRSRSGRQSRSMAPTRRRLTNAVFSPDGRWVAYGSDESGTDAVYVQPFPATGAKFQISRGDVGHHALWSRDGKQLFYIPGPGRFVVVNVTTQPSFSVSAPVPAPRAFTIGNAQTSPRNHDVGPDGRMLGIVTAGRDPSTPATPPQSSRPQLVRGVETAGSGEIGKAIAIGYRVSAFSLSASP